jgi:FtsP/CotA-like multicopper oxidase with cupredoxin domain
MKVPLATVKQGQPEVWTVKNGGGWSHPMHFHMEEHQILTRNGKKATTVPGHADDTGKDDVIAMDPSEVVTMYRNFRTFTGRYVAHCHNLAHEDHAMMFGWVLAK